ncbi:MAG: hypothetical protein A2048_00750 [Deltaproteobacteria bacterium GWA2_45_12]|nr:MAG: hypothetical protein A2048_00750 [Deltaproteobacteria bacterium GWA2_45_12]
MKSTTEINVRFSDCDPMGHVNNANYFTYMEQARVVFFKNFYDLPTEGHVGPETFPFILAEISCRFLKPVFVDQNLVVHLRVSEVKNSSFFFEYELKEKSTGDLAATGKSAQVYYDYKIGKPMPLPKEFREKLLR